MTFIYSCCVFHDPHNNSHSQHPQLEYECRFVEHKGTRLVPCCSRIVGYTYTKTLGCVYNLLLIVVGLGLALCWGTVYAVVAFVQVWLCMPLQAIQILCIKGCCQLLLEPMRLCFETMSKACRVKNI